MHLSIIIIGMGNICIINGVPYGMGYLQFELYRERDIRGKNYSIVSMASFPNLLKIMNTCEFH